MNSWWSILSVRLRIQNCIDIHRTLSKESWYIYIFWRANMNSNKWRSILLWILVLIKQENLDQRNPIKKWISDIYKEEKVSFEQVFYFFFFDIAFMTHSSTFGVCFLLWSRSGTEIFLEKQGFYIKDLASKVKISFPI